MTIALVGCLDDHLLLLVHMIYTDITELGHAKAVLDNGRKYFGGVTQDGSFVM
jgi:hypothetical protein